MADIRVGIRWVALAGFVALGVLGHGALGPAPDSLARDGLGSEQPPWLAGSPNGNSYSEPSVIGEPDAGLPWPENDWPKNDWPGDGWPEDDWPEDDWNDPDWNPDFPWFPGPMPEPGLPPDEGVWDGWAHDKVMVCPRDPVALAAELAQLDLGLELLSQDIAVVEVPWDLPPREFMQLIDVLARLDGACAVEPDFWFTSPEGTHRNAIVVGSTFGRSDFKKQPALRRVRAKAAHRITTARGRNVVIAVVDTGVDRTHEALAGRVLSGYDFVALDGDPSEERNHFDDDLDGEADEGYGHGTFIAGLALAAAPDARILPVRVLDDEGRGSASAVAAGIDFAVAEGAHVINLSLGMDQQSLVVEERVRAAIDAGVTVVVAAGNNGRRARVQFPADVEGVISVTSLGSGRRRAGFADGRVSADVAAPGRGVIGPYPGARWGRSSGTSFSAALVSGAVAVTRSHHPRWSAEQVRKAVTDRTRLRINRLVK